MDRRVSPNDRPMREVRPIRLRFEDLFPSCVDCHDLADGLDNRCSRCAYEKAFSERQELRRQARAAGR